MPPRAQRVAASVRRRLGFMQPPANPAMLLAYAPIDVVVLDWPPELSGVLVMRRHGPVIGLNRRHSPERRHFSFWHEVGHYLIHRPRLSSGLLACPHPASPRMADLDLEREADIFAANVMMPADWVRRSHRRQSTLQALARDFGVTPTAMMRRLRELGLRPVASSAGGGFR
ncbi:MAG: ImmA/IrrE family metallo-endopeptidase [Chloroflexi bacterium]|nr:ImmA/IrrE family metallo-endopeptidase [Chloroflexota bacterium]